MPEVFCPFCGKKLEPIDGSWYKAAQEHKKECEMIKVVEGEHEV